MGVLGEIEGYAAAVRKETFERTAAYIGGCNETLCGVTVRPLTPRLALELEAAGSPFFNGRIPEPWEVMALLWHISPMRLQVAPWWWLAGAKRWRTRQQRAIAAVICERDFVETVTAIHGYIDEANLDGPGGGGSGGGPAFASWASGIVDYFANRYGWSEADVLDVPWKRLWQYWRRVKYRETNGEVEFINVLSDRIRADYLKSYNEAQASAGKN